MNLKFVIVYVYAFIIKSVGVIFFRFALRYIYNLFIIAIEI